MRPADAVHLESRERLVPRLLDFGLAKVARPAGTPSPECETLTADHKVAGTLAYMAPEQISPDGKRVAVVMPEKESGNRELTG